MTRPWWTPTLVAGICQMFGIGMLGVFGFFVAPLSEEFSVGVAVINIGPVLMLLAPALAGPVAGNLADKYPIRSLMLAGVVAATASLFLVSASGTIIMLGLGYLLYTLSMTFYGPIVINTLMIRIFHARAAWALSISAIGTSVGAVTLPFVAAWLLDSRDWREAIVLLACGSALLLLLAIRMGLPRFVPVSSNQVTTEAEPEQTDNQFFRRREFWVIGLAAALIANVAVVASISYAPHFGSLGFSNTDVASFLAAGGLGGFTAKLAVAAWVDRFRQRLKWVVALVVTIKLLAVVLLLIADTFPVALCATFLMGASGGAYLPLHPYMNSAYFDQSYMGRVNGAQAPIMLPVGLVCTPLAGYVFDQTGSYQLVFAAGLVALLGTLWMVASLPPVGKSQATPVAGLVGD